MLMVARILFLGISGHVVLATRDTLVGQYVGHTAPKTKEVIKQAMGGILFIDEGEEKYKPFFLFLVFFLNRP